MAAEALYRRGGILDSFGDLFGLGNYGDPSQIGETEKDAQKYGGFFRRWRSPVAYLKQAERPPIKTDYSDTNVGGFFGDGFDERMEQSLADPNRPRRKQPETPPTYQDEKPIDRGRGKKEKDGAAQIAASVARGVAEGILGYEGEGGRHFAGKNLAALAGFGAGVLIFLSASSQHLQSVESGQVSSSSPATSYLLWSIPFVGAYVAYKLYCWYYKI